VMDSREALVEKALRFYADESNWDEEPYEGYSRASFDQGQIAREALGVPPPPQEACSGCAAQRKLDVLVGRLEQAELSVDLYEAMSKAIERALFGDDLGRSRDELVERAEQAREALG
jgi:hypothetical protein